MKRVSSTRRLQLNKETLRTLNADELQAAAGATGFFCRLTEIDTWICLPPPIKDPKGPNSLPCGGTSLCFGGLGG